jgi:predicted nucleic acid-binding protein
VTITHVLDTSALLAHFFDEPGADAVQSLWDSGSEKPGICAVTVTELKARLKEELASSEEAQEAVEAYFDELTVCLPVDRAVAELAWQVKESCPDRIPLVDALIAGTARAFNAVLVHRDPHLARIPREVVGQVVLPRS